MIDEIKSLTVGQAVTVTGTRVDRPQSTWSYTVTRTTSPGRARPPFYHPHEFQISLVINGSNTYGVQAVFALDLGLDLGRHLHTIIVTRMR
jgi:hypothetical protein